MSGLEEIADSAGSGTAVEAVAEDENPEVPTLDLESVESAQDGEATEDLEEVINEESSWQKEWEHIISEYDPLLQQEGGPSDSRKLQKVRGKEDKQKGKPKTTLKPRVDIP